MHDIITPQDVMDAVNHAQKQVANSRLGWNGDIAGYLNQRIEQRFNHRWRRYGLALEGFGMGGVCIGILALWTPGQTVEGILLAVIGFFVGIVGHGMSGPV